MSGIEWEKDDPFKDKRDEVENPMLRLFREYGSRHYAEFIIGLSSSIFSRVLDLLPPLMLGIAIDAVFGDAVFAEQIPLVLLPEEMLPGDSVAQFWFVVWVIVFAYLIGAVFHWLRNWGFNSFAQNIQHGIRTDTYDNMQRLNMEFFTEKQTGEMMSVLSNDVNRLEQFLNDGLNSFFRIVVMVLGIGFLLIWINWQLALISLLPVPIIAFFTYVFIKIIQPKYARVRSTVGKLNSRLENNLTGIKIIKASNTESYESGRVVDVSMDYFDANWDAITTRIKFFPGLRVLSGFGFVLTFIVGGLWVLSGPPGPLTGELSLGMFVVFIIFTQRFVWPMAQFGQIVNMYQRARASSARIFGLMDEPSRIKDDADAPSIEISNGTVEYRDVGFGYDEKEVLEDVSFRVDGGDTLALVGPTGAGKSTVFKLLMRMYEVDRGVVEIDEQDIRDVSLRSLRESIGYVGQDPFLFYGTVEENIKYGSFNAGDEEMREAAEAAEAHSFIEELPDGYDTMVGERGMKLSGGQKQRIVIARAILRDPSILLLDEATSDVDTETEMLIQRSINRLSKNRTSLVIAHRLSTIRDADEIIVLDNGRVVERGSHDELLEEDGLYAYLWSIQAGEIEGISEEYIEKARKREIDIDDD